MKTTLYISTILLALFVSTTLTAQEQLTEKQLYKQAILTNNTVLCMEYLSTYPDGKFTLKVEKKLETLSFIEAYNVAGIEFNTDLMTAYINNYPNGEYVEKANEVLTALKYQEERYNGKNPKFLAKGAK